MRFPETPNKTGLVFSPWEVRSGTVVTVTYSFVEKKEWTWDSNATFSDVVTGTPYTTSIKCDYPIEEDHITITGSGVVIDPIGYGPVGLTIYNKRTTTESVTARAAITAADAEYYNDWFYDEAGTAIPMTVVPLTLLANEQTYKPEDFAAEYDQPERGITMLNGEEWTSDSVGTVKMVDPTDDFSMSRNLFREGKMEVEVPLDCKIEPVIRYTFLGGSRMGKIVEVDLQDWIDNIRLDVRGILWHRDYLYALTDTGLHRFERWGDFDVPGDSFSNVTGTDLTYCIDDKFLVCDGQTVKVYSVRHDLLHYDKDTEVIRHREEVPEYRVDE
jgi:hypothetical protein